MVEGMCAAEFAEVEDVFAANFAERDEQGAAIRVRVDGRTVVDLCGGDGWTRDTLVNVFSVGKGLTALVAARLAGTGRLDVGKRVADYWPEFGAAGKDAITVAELLSHQAGLPALRERLPEGAMLDHRFMAGVLAAEEPWWEPGAGHGYHVNTFGFLVGEVVRRAAGRSIGELLRTEIGGDVHIGLPAGEHRRVVDFHWPGEPVAIEPPAERLMEHNAYFNPPGLSGAGVVNTAAWRSAEIPSTNAHASAGGIADVYAALLAGRLVEPGALADATTERAYGTDLVLGRSTRFGLGFQLTQPERPFGPDPGAFGHFGAGGSVGFCDPAAGVAFGYVTGRLGHRWLNDRNGALIDAVYRCL